MFFELIATFAAGAGVAGLVLVLNRLTGRRLPGGAVPVAAGLAMLAYAIWSEMTWADRTIATLPEGIELVQTVEERIMWKPWTYLMPQATRLMAVDRATSRQNAEAPDIHLVDLYLHARWQPLSRRPQLINCATFARADVSDAALADPASVTGWIPLGQGDPLIDVVCSG